MQKFVTEDVYQSKSKRRWKSDDMCQCYSRNGYRRRLLVAPNNSRNWDTNRLDSSNQQWQVGFKNKSFKKVTSEALYQDFKFLIDLNWIWGRNITKKYVYFIWIWHDVSVNIFFYLCCYCFNWFHFKHNIFLRYYIKFPLIKKIIIYFNCTDHYCMLVHIFCRCEPKAGDWLYMDQKKDLQVSQAMVRH